MNFYNRLILHPKELDYVPPGQAVWREFLAEIQLLGTPWNYQKQTYFLIGKQFLNLVMFMGCAPSIEFEAPKEAKISANFVAISLPEFYSQAIFYPPSDNYSYRCPSCKTPIGPLKRRKIHKQTQFNCPNCEKLFAYTHCNWRHQAGSGRCFIEIMGIFPQEAIPSQMLLQQLQEYSAVQWDYFYIANI